MIDLSYFTPIEIEQHAIGINKQRKNTIAYKSKNKPIKGNSSKTVTKKSNRFVMDNYEVKVSINDIIYPILNKEDIINDCLLYPTSLNYMHTNPKHFKIVEDLFKDRVELIKTFWSRYDFKKQPNIKEITSEGVILEE
jgi:hypothetical protein